MFSAAGGIASECSESAATGGGRWRAGEFVRQFGHYRRRNTRLPAGYLSVRSVDEDFRRLDVNTKKDQPILPIDWPFSSNSRNSPSNDQLAADDLTARIGAEGLAGVLPGRFMSHSSTGFDM